MATVNLGAIKFNWKGAYNNSTQYQVDDVVSSGGSSYICILASQGNAVSNGTYWEQMSAAGTNGTNGTDVGTTITTQGDILYRDGSGLQRLAAGTSGQVLQTGGSGANPSWGTVSSDYVKIITATGGGTTALAIDSCFSATYENYLVVANLFASGGNLGAYIRLQNASNTEQTGSNYRYAATQIYIGSSANGTDHKVGWNQTEISMQENIGTDAGNFGTYFIYVAKPFVSNSMTNFFYDFVNFDNSYMRSVRGSAVFAVQQQNAGIRFTSSNSNTFSSDSKVTVYGIKQ